MAVEYDNYYRTDDLFGEPYKELVDFYSTIQNKGKLLDLGCGQGRDAIALARLGYDVVGIDYSKIGIEQLNKIAQQEKLPLKGIVSDVYDYTTFDEFDFILLDSMFHFRKPEKEKEKQLLKKIIKGSKSGAYITVCIQKTGDKLTVLNSIFSESLELEIFHQKELIYKFEDKESNHVSETVYEMITVQKMKTTLIER